MTLFTGGDPTLHEARFDAALKATHLGQAHIAGTGPEGKTCRECRFFGLLNREGEIASPGYYGKSSEFANCLKQARCHKPIPHKPKRRFPHHALACRLFEQDDSPFPAIKEDVDAVA
jgi:hypothetical protein